MLYKIPDFWLGFGSIWGIFGNFFDFKMYKTDKQADIEALKNDWGVLGNDLETSLQKFLNSSEFKSIEKRKFKFEQDKLERELFLSQMHNKRALIEYTKQLKEVSSLASKYQFKYPSPNRKRRANIKMINERKRSRKTT